MSKIKKIQLPDETVYDIDLPDNNPTKLNTVFSVMSLSTVAGSTTSGAVKSVRWYVSDVAGHTAPYDGMKLAIKIPLAGVSTGGVIFSMNGNTDADFHPVAYNVNSVLSSQFAAGTVKYFTYDANATMTCYKSAGTSVTITGVWKADANYDTNTTTTYGLISYYFRPYTAQRLTGYKLVALDKDNRVVPITTEQYMGTYSTSTTYVIGDIVVKDGDYYRSKANSNKNKAVTNTTYWETYTMPTQFTPNTTPFKPNKLWFYNTTTALAASAATGGQTLTPIGYNTNVCTYTFWATISTYKLIYLQGTYDRTTGLFTLDTGANYYKLVPDNTANLTLSSFFTSGKDYILVGSTYSSNNYFQLFMVNTMYHFDGTNLVPYETYNAKRIEDSIPASEEDTLATVTARGATTTTPVTFNGGASCSDITVFNNDAEITFTSEFIRITNLEAETTGVLYYPAMENDSEKFMATKDDIKITGVTDGLFDLSISNKNLSVSAYSSKGAGHFDTGTTNPTNTNRLNYDGYLYATKLYSGGSEVLTSVKSLKTDNTSAQTPGSESITGTGNINLHKVAKTGTYGDLIGTPTLGTAAAKDYTTSVTSGSTDLVTSGAVWTAIDNLPEPMVFKGTLGTGGTITSLPTASSSEGFTYKVITAGTYASQSAKVGDAFVSNGSEWVLIPAGDDIEDTWRNIKVNGTELLGTGISTGAVNFKNGTNVTITGSGNDITISASQPTVNNGTLSIQGNGTTASTFTANQSGNTTLNIKGSGGTTVTKSADNEITISTGTIPTVNNATLTIQNNGVTVNTFTANASSNVTANITTPQIERYI